MSIVYHTLEPWFDEYSNILILGTMPSVKSREFNCYYGHPQNRFWKTLAAVFDEPIPQGTEECQTFAKYHHLALWDVLESCDINGSQDASITKEIPNDLMLIISGSPIRCIVTTGAKSKSLYDRFWKDRISVPVIALPSTSPANRRWADDDTLISAYGILREWLK